jgi:hypothetical protein
VVMNRRTGAIVRGGNDVHSGDRLDIRLLHGTITAVTEECYG